MCTGCSLTVCCSLLPGGVSLVGGLLPGRGVSLAGGVFSLAVGGGGLPGRGLSQHALRQTPPVDRILDTRLWKYYLGPTSLWPVNREVQCITGNGYKGIDRPMDRQIDRHTWLKTLPSFNSIGRQYHIWIIGYRLISLLESVLTSKNNESMSRYSINQLTD